jgi:hypothetical protein
VVAPAIALAFGLSGDCGVDLGCGVGYFMEAAKELVASVK